MKRLLFATILLYLKFFAKLQLLKLQPIVIGITGSNGKTSAMASVEAVLKQNCRIKVSHKANSEIGLPLDILGLKIKKNSISEWLQFVLKAPWQVLKSKKTYDIYIAEMGVDSPFPPQNMSYLLSFIRPTVGIFLNARAVHSEPYQPLAKETDPEKRKAELISLIAQEKGKMIETLPASGTAILNYDDENVRITGQHSSATATYYGKDSDLPMVIKRSIQSLKGTTFNFSYNSEQITIDVANALLPHHFAYSIAPALLAGIACNLTITQAVQSFNTHFKLPPARSSLIPGVNGSIILDSSYNAATQTMIDSLELLSLSNGRKLALLGDIRELGDVTQSEHEMVAQVAAELCDEIFLVGPYMKAYALPVIKEKNTPVTWFRHAGEAAGHIKKILKKDDLLLVKASQNTLLFEIAVELLMACPEDAEKLLCRREPFWNKKRAEIVAS